MEGVINLSRGLRQTHSLVPVIIDHCPAALLRSYAKAMPTCLDTDVELGKAIVLGGAGGALGCSSTAPTIRCHVQKSGEGVSSMGPSCGME